MRLHLDAIRNRREAQLSRVQHPIVPSRIESEKAPPYCQGYPGTVRAILEARPRPAHSTWNTRAPVFGLLR